MNRARAFLFVLTNVSPQETLLNWRLICLLIKCFFLKKRVDVGPSLPAHEVSEDVEPIEIWGFTASVHVPSGN